jgi:hypothetical protein
MHEDYHVGYFGDERLKKRRYLIRTKNASSQDGVFTSTWRKPSERS